MPEILLTSVKFAEYGNNLITATYKLVVQLAYAGATVYVTSVTTDEDEQEKEKKLAQEVTKNIKTQVIVKKVHFTIYCLITDILIWIFGILA